jgi:phosphonate transport system substrate-binding protein
MVATVLSVGVSLGGGCSSPEPTGKPLRFTAIPDDNTSELRRKFQPLAKYLSRQLGIEVEYIPSSDYSASVEMFKNGDVQLAWFGGLTGAQARAAVEGAHAIVQGEEDRSYYSYFIANASTGLVQSAEFPRGIAKYRFSFGPAQSTSGRLMPEYYIRRETGRAPREFFEHGYSYSGSHAQTLALVSSGAFEVGVVNYRTYGAQVKSGKVDTSLVRVIWKTPTYADYNFTVHPVVHARYGGDFIERLQGALLGLKDEALLSSLRRTALVEANDEEYLDLSAIARSLDLLR